MSVWRYAYSGWQVRRQESSIKCFIDHCLPCSLRSSLSRNLELTDWLAVSPWGLLIFCPTPLSCWVYVHVSSCLDLCVCVLVSSLFLWWKHLNKKQTREGKVLFDLPVHAMIHYCGEVKARASTVKGRKQISVWSYVCSQLPFSSHTIQDSALHICPQANLI